MSSSEQLAPSTPNTPPRGKSSLWQWNIATLLILMAAVSVWTSYFHLTSETARLLAELDSLSELARELVIADPAQYAFIERHEEWNADDVWEVYLPEGGRYIMKLATRGINMSYTIDGVPTNNYPDTDNFAEIAAGRHVISLEKDFTSERPSGRVILDGQLALEALETDDWKPPGGYSSNGTFERSTQSSTDKPLELIRLRFHKRMPTGASAPPDGPHNGLLLWIEQR